MVVCWSSIRCWLLVCWPTSSGLWYAGPALVPQVLVAGVLADQPGMVICWSSITVGAGCWPTSLRCCVLADQPGMLVCWPTSPGCWCAGQHMLSFGC
ncbi:uncharacterized [Tachysurus ichikawai]